MNPLSLLKAFNMNPNQLYYVARPGGSQQGPWTATVIAAMVQSGKLPMDSLVWTEGMAEWQPVSSIMGGVTLSPSYAGSWNPIVAFKTCLKRYCQFSGRASRSEYWFFVLANLLIYVSLQILSALLGAMLGEDSIIAVAFIFTVAQFVLQLGLLLPGLSVLVRRLHDTGRSGWWFFISWIPFIGGIWLLVLMCLDSTGPNQYGAGSDGPLA